MIRNFKVNLPPSDTLFGGGFFNNTPKPNISTPKISLITPKTRQKCTNFPTKNALKH